MKKFSLVDIPLLQEDLNKAIDRMNKAKFGQEKFFILYYEVNPLANILQSVLKEENEKSNSNRHQ